MNALKQLPIAYKGELHEVKLINFSVDKSELEGLVPEGINVRDFDGRAMISMVNVKLRNMRPKGFPTSLSFDYRHVAFRLLVDDSEHNDGECKGIYFIRSFTDKPWVAWSGSMFTHYQLTNAFLSGDQKFELRQGQYSLQYELTEEEPFMATDLREIIQPLDRAYAMDGKNLLRTQIQREAWPIRPVQCVGVRTNFFTTAQFLGAFEVKEVIDYEWLAPIMV